MEDRTPRTEHEPAADAGWERKDVHIVGVVRFALGLFVGTALFMVAMWILQSKLTAREVRSHARVAPTTRVAGDEPQRPPGPVLQGAPGSNVELVRPELELARLREEEAKLLDSYAWIDRATGTVRIPVERAKDLMAERGFDVRPEYGGEP